MAKYAEQANEEKYNNGEVENNENKETKIDPKLEKKILFSLKHPILAKISGFFKKLFRRDNEQLEESSNDDLEIYDNNDLSGEEQGKDVTEKVEELEVETEPNTKKEEFMESIDARNLNTTPEQVKMEEDELLKLIAEKGQEKVFIDRLTETKARAKADAEAWKKNHSEGR